MSSSKGSVKEFALIGFILLAVLFGMQIMTFIFGSLGSVDQFTDDVLITTNETGAYINETGYAVDKASESDFTGGVSITGAWNYTDDVGTVIISANYTIDPNTGILTNATDFTWASVNVSYTSSHKSEAEVVSDETINQSLRAIGKYSEQSGTQFTTLGIAITLIILVAVFLFFWQAFMGRKKGETGTGGFS